MSLEQLIAKADPELRDVVQPSLSGLEELGMEKISFHSRGGSPNWIRFTTGQPKVGSWKDLVISRYYGKSLEAEFKVSPNPETPTSFSNRRNLG